MWCTASVTVPPHAESSGRARRLVAGHLRDWLVPEDIIADAALMLAEAVTNAIVHAGTDSTISVVLSDEHLDVMVTDLTPRQPSGPSRLTQPPSAGAGAGARAGPLAESGRGLQIIDALAQSWGVLDLAVGKQLWFRLHVARSPEEVLPAGSWATDQTGS